MVQSFVSLRVNVNAPTAQALVDLAQRRGVGLAEALRGAVSLLHFVELERAKGRLILSYDPDSGTADELVDGRVA